MTDRVLVEVMWDGGQDTYRGLQVVTLVNGIKERRLEQLGNFGLDYYLVLSSVQSDKISEASRDCLRRFVLSGEAWRSVYFSKPRILGDPLLVTDVERIMSDENLIVCYVPQRIRISHYEDYLVWVREAFRNHHAGQS